MIGRVSRQASFVAFFAGFASLQPPSPSARGPRLPGPLRGGDEVEQTTAAEDGATSHRCVIALDGECHVLATEIEVDVLDGQSAVALTEGEGVSLEAVAASEVHDRLGSDTVRCFDRDVAAKDRVVLVTGGRGQVRELIDRPTLQHQGFTVLGEEVRIERDHLVV
jgi:hypothetical protein